MTGLYRYSIRHPRRVMIMGLMITLGMAPGIFQLTLRTDGHALIPTHAPEIHTDQSIRDLFEVNDPIVVMIETKNTDGIFNTETLQLVQNLSDQFAEMAGVQPHDIFSLATEFSDRVYPGTLTFRRFLEPVPATQKELLRLRNDMREIKIYQGTLVSYHEATTSIMIGVPDNANRTAFYHAVLDIIDHTNTTADRITVIGSPVAESQLGTHILDDLGVPSFLLGHHRLQRNIENVGRVPTNLYTFRVWISQNIGLVPIAIVVMAMVFFISFRSVAAVSLPLMEVGACLIFIFGLMGYSDTPLYLTTAVLPIILTAIGVADEIHIFARYRELLREQSRNTDNTNTISDSNEILLKTMDEMHRPVIKTSITTAIGFLSFALSPIGAVQAFGIFTAVGVLWCMLWSLTVIPAQLAMIHPKRFTGNVNPVTQQNRPCLFQNFAIGVVRLRWFILIIAIAIAAYLPAGIKQIYVQDSWIDGFAPDSEFYQATQTFNEQFFGTHILQVCVESGQFETMTGTIPAKKVGRYQISLPGTFITDPKKLIDKWIRIQPVESKNTISTHQITAMERVWKARIENAERVGEDIVITGARRHGMPRVSIRLSPGETVQYEIIPYSFKKPALIQKIKAFESFLALQKTEAVGGVLGPASYLLTTNFMAGGRKEKFNRVPDTLERMDWIWNQYDRVRGEGRRKQLIDNTYSKALITIFLKNANFIDTRRLIQKIREYEQQHLKPHDISLSFAGDVAVSQTLIDAIVTTQVRSLLGSIIGIFLITSLMGRSFLVGLFSVLPCALAVSMNFAVMGFVSMPLGVATSMFVGMTLGIGVDFAIHLLERYRLSRSNGMNNEAAVVDAIRATGPAITIDALGVALGFGVMMLSQVPANARLGGLLVLSIIICLAATMLLLPALLRIIYRNDK